MPKLEVQADSFPLKQPFTISRGTVSAVDVVTVVIRDGTSTGRGECRPYARYDETVGSVIDQIEDFRFQIEQGASRDDLQTLVSAGAARNALDCALWDLKAKRTGKPVWQLAGLHEPSAKSVTYTISLATPERMAQDAVSCGRSLLKLKLGAAGDLERIQHVRRAAPNARLIVDANEGWDLRFLLDHAEEMSELGVEMIEQPLAASLDDQLRGYTGPVPVCADESCHGVADLERLSALYSFINIKLDKTGGLTGAIAFAEAAVARDMSFMLGCMMASSLAMAPAFLLADRAHYVDLDAPLLLASDRDDAFEFDGEIMMPPSPWLWG